MPSPDPFQEVTPPELLQAEWPADQVKTYFAELAEGAEVEHVQLRCRTEAGSEESTGTLQDAVAAFGEGRAVAIQIRYQFQAELWIDTLMPNGEQTRIIRNRMPST